MADIEIIKGADNGNPPDTLREMYPKVNRNFQRLNTEFIGHISSKTAHRSEDITYNGQVPGVDVKQAIDNVNGRISEIVAQAGDDNTEIVDARGEYPVLSARLNGVDEKTENNLVSITDIELKYDQNTFGTNNGFVTFLDDDGHIDVYNILKPMFDAQGKKFTSAIITSFSGSDSNYMTWNQIKEMQSQGYDIASHTHTHRRLAQLTDEEQLYELQESKRVLLSNGITPNHVVYPYGDYNNFTMDNVLRYYRSGVATKIASQQNGLLPPLTTAKISRIGLGSYQDLTTTEIKNRILTAKAEGRWVILMTHIWANNAENPPEGNVGAIQDVLSHCVSNGVNIVTYDEGFRRYCNKLEVGNNNITGRPYYVVGADLGEYSNVDNLQNRTVYSTPVLIGTEKPSYFPLNKVVYREVTGANAGSLPGVRAGVLITERFGTNLGYAKQTYKHHARNDVFIRSGNDDDTWTSWVKLSYTSV